MRTLVTGATGFAGSALVPPLVAAGHDVRAFARDPSRVAHDVPAFRGDVLTGEGLDAALDGVDVAYYLVHSMEASTDGLPFEERERRSAEHFAEAARAADVRRTVYLGVMVDETRPLSSHLRSRLAVERSVVAATPEAVALRASIAIGPGSRSFRFLVRLVERVPVLPLPPWRTHRTQPIDERDVTAALVSAATTDAADGARLSLDIAGPDVLSYGEILERIRDLMMLRRPSIGIPFSSTPIFGRVASVLAGESPELILPLMGGLSGDLLVRDDSWARTLGVRPHGFDRAVNHALLQWEREEPLRAR
ncbi:NAD(P)H-binding protein [Patulibacter minatonensis]|uniref:NAD(P)H-binding protein n=1 Tax=Patulibacter minatonensis TaxID=298163 RepID=UPI00047B826C|nr:NAD(P)H-binding protein [Patulibacter minatonensis]